MSESDAVHDVVALVVHQFQFDMFLFASYDLARSVVIYMLRTKQRFRIVRPERIELFKVVVKLVRDIFEVYLRVDVQYGRSLFRQDMCFHVSFEAPVEFRYVFHFHGQARCIRMSPEILQ